MQELSSAFAVAAIGFGITAALALTSTHTGAWLFIGCAALAFLVLGPGLTLWQKIKRSR